MADWYLPTVMVLQVLSGVLYIAVGAKVGRRNVSQEAQLAVHLFQFWWYGLGAISLLSPALVFASMYGLLSVPLWVALIDVLLGVVCLAIFGLVYYLLYVYTGRRAWLWPTAVFYGLVFLGVLALIAYIDPHEPFVGEPLNRHPSYSNDLTGSPWGAALGLSLIGPPFLAAIAYAALYFRVQDRTARYRISMVSGAFVFQFGVGLAAQFLGLSGGQDPNHSWRIASMFIGMMSAIIVLLAYLPPVRVQRWLHVDSIAAERTG